jgi:NAD(P)-dependent dehydrogenase (short-subunit alcohol dehydrogenase family)
MKRSISKVALVTGGARRLGRQIALALASEGYDIVISYNRSALKAKRTVKEIRDRGVKVMAIKADISQKKDIDRLFKVTLKAFGRIDLLVNNAATYISSPLPKTTEKIWDTTIDTNLKGTFFCAQAVAATMVKQKTGKIINIASLGGVQAWKEHIPYSVSKAGVIMLTRILAKSLAPNIQVNAIAPGTIIIEGEENPAIRHIPKKSILLQRYGQSSDITSLLIYLATTADYITGQTFIVDGGRNLNN